MGDNTSSLSNKHCGRNKSQMNASEVKPCLRHLGRKNYLEQDEDTMSDYGPSPSKKSRASTTNRTGRKLSLRCKKVVGEHNFSVSKEVENTVNKEVENMVIKEVDHIVSKAVEIRGSNEETMNNCLLKVVTPKRKYTKWVSSPSDRQLRKQANVESTCCAKVTSIDITSSELACTESNSRKSKGRKSIYASHDLSVPEVKSSPKEKLQPSAISTSNRKSSLKLKPELSKPRVIDHFQQSEEINIESTSLVVPKKSTELKKNIMAADPISKRRSTLSQKPWDNSLPKLNGVSHRNSITQHGKLCRKAKKCTIFHDSNGWMTSKAYHMVGAEFWDWTNFSGNQEKRMKTQEEIEIPSFRERKYTPLYKIEGTEDLSDHVFEERHLPYEIMEKKIKKNFVMQSKYEAQKSKYLKHNELLYKRESFVSKKFPKAVDLTQDAANVKKIEIVSEVPVMAFGVPIKQVDMEEFHFIPGFGE